MNTYQEQRIDILKLLYAQREKAPERGWVWRKDLRNAVGDCDFSMAYLIERGMIAQNGHQYRITANGMDVVEADFSN